MRKIEEFYCKTRPTKQEIESFTTGIKCYDLFQELPIIRLSWDCPKYDLLPEGQRADNVSGTMRMSIEFDENASYKDVVKKIDDEYAKYERMFGAIYSTNTEESK